MKLIFCTAFDTTEVTGATIYSTRVLQAIHILGLKVEVVMVQFYVDNSPPLENNWFHGLRDLKAKEIKFTVLPAKHNSLFF